MIRFWETTVGELLTLLSSLGSPTGVAAAPARLQNHTQYQIDSLKCQANKASQLIIHSTLSFGVA